MHRLNAAAGLLAAMLFVLCGLVPLTAQTGQVPAGVAPFLAVGAATAAPESETLTFVNRPIVVFRATVVGRSPAERAASAGELLQELVDEGIVGPVDAQQFELGTVVTVGAKAVIVLTPPDADTLAGQTLEQLTVTTLARLRVALTEAGEARSPRLLLRGLALALLALVLAGLALGGVARGQRWAVKRLGPIAARRLARSGIGAGAIRQSRLLDIERQLFGYGSVALDLVIVYLTTTFILRQLPYTRPWGESMRGFLLRTLQDLGASFLGAIPGLFTVALIMVITRLIVRALTAWFRSIEEGRIAVPWIFPDTALPTRRLVTALLWLVAIAVSYPYMPGSGTDAFKGLSVFVGLLVSFGSSGLVNQLMAGFMITYSRSLRLKEFVRIGDAEGTVTYIGVLATRVRTVQNEEVTIPNAVVATQTTTNYSRAAGGGQVMTPTSVTIGYDTPWRQVHALLLEAAGATSGLRADPAPVVYQTSLDDFYVKYTLFVCLEHQEARLEVFDALHANIQDQFNAYGVQIMSPNYVLDPKTPKVVAKDQWFASPAKIDAQGEPTARV